MLFCFVFELKEEEEEEEEEEEVEEEEEETVMRSRRCFCQYCPTSKTIVELLSFLALLGFLVFHF